jgi:hypothetical protein
MRPLTPALSPVPGERGHKGTMVEPSTSSKDQTIRRGRNALRLGADSSFVFFPRLCGSTAG